MTDLNSLDEKELLIKLRSGDEHAFDNIFHAFYASLCYFANRLIENKFIAEEIVQDSLFHVWQKHTEFYSLQSLKAFLYISTRNACYNQIKKEASKANHQQAITKLYEPDEETVLHRIIETEVFYELHSAVGTLPEQCRKVMTMIVDGQKPKDIAEALGVTVSTVNNQKMRGISLLKDRLSGEGIATLLIFISSSLIHH